MLPKSVKNIVLPFLIGPFIGFALCAVVAFSVKTIFQLDKCQREICVAIPGYIFGSIFGIGALVYAFSFLKHQVLNFQDRVALWAVTTFLLFLMAMCPLTLLLVPVSFVLNVYLFIKHRDEAEEKPILPLALNEKEKLLMQETQKEIAQ